MIKSELSLKTIEEAISNADLAEQRKLLRDLPHLLKISRADLGLLKSAEKSFDFWNNPDDSVYDH